MTEHEPSAPRRRQLLSLVVVTAVVAATWMVFSGVAEAKVLPYQLEVRPTRAEVGHPISIAVTLDPQNVLGDQFDWEIAVYRDNAMTRDGWMKTGALPVEKVVMSLVSAEDHTYQGSFTPEKRGRYVVVGAAAQPRRGADARCLPAAAVTRWRCWPSPVLLTIRTEQ